MSLRPGPRRAAWLGAAAPAALLWVGCVDDGGPRIDRVSPPAAAAGATVEVVGERFCAGAASASCHEEVAGFVTFGLEPPQRRGLIASWTDSRIQVVVPAQAPGSADVIVTVDGRSSNAADFEVQ